MGHTVETQLALGIRVQTSNTFAAPVADDGLGAVLCGELPHLDVAVLGARHQPPAGLQPRQPRDLHQNRSG